ncbi:zinc-binding dehydrogenase [Streptomyces sp. NPDC001393]
MRAIYAEAPAPEDPLGALVAGERPEPEVPDGWTSLRVSSASLNMHDLWALRGVGIKADRFPMILGMDAVGTLADGTRAIVHPVISDPDFSGDETLDPRRSLLTEVFQGTLASTVVVPKRNIVPIPDDLPDSHAAVLGTAWLTAYRMLFTRSGLRPGQTMLVQGASGGVSTALIQLGRAAGFRVWVTGRTEAKRKLAESLGADAVFEPGARLPAKVDAVFESVGEATWSHSMKSLRPGGAIIICGASTGANPPADLQRLFFLQLRVEGATMGTRAELADLVQFVHDRGIEPTIGLEVPFDDAKSAFAALADGQTNGKIVISGIG